MATGLQQYLVKDMIKLGGIFAVREAGNFLWDKVGKHFITSYLNHMLQYDKPQKSPFAIILELHAFIYSMGCQRVNDSGAKSTAEASF